MTTVTRILEWDAAHRVLGHEGKCATLHGHRYRAEVTVEAPSLDRLGRVVDFNVIKQHVGGFINSCWDHNTLLHEDDPLLKGDVVGLVGRMPYVFAGQRNPTAEVIAEVLCNAAQSMLQSYQLTVVKVRVWETPSCYAEFCSKSRT